MTATGSLLESKRSRADRPYQFINLDQLAALLRLRARGCLSACAISGVPGSYRYRQRLDNLLDLPNCSPGRIRRGL